jgi:hypothetical protein
MMVCIIRFDSIEKYSERDGSTGKNMLKIQILYTRRSSK